MAWTDRAIIDSDFANPGVFMLDYMIIALALLLSPLALAAEAAPASAPLYAATFTGTDGQPVELARLRGKVAVVNFWASWCPPCRKEMPDLEAAYARHRGQGIAFVGIAVEDDLERVKEFARANGIDFPLATGKEQGIALLQALGNSVAGLPYTLVLDSSGNVVAARRGPIGQARLEEALQKATAGSGEEAN